VICAGERLPSPSCSMRLCEGFREWSKQTNLLLAQTPNNHQIITNN
jgi:hypothetical protein